MRRAAACSGATTRRTTGPRAGCPPEIRPATHALYGYVRTADEIVDGPHRPASARRAAPRWTPGRPSCSAGWPRAGSPPVVRALVDAGAPPRAAARRAAAPTCARCGSTARPVRIEHAGRSCESYMDGSAGSVGRIMAPLLGVPARHHAELGRLGQAFQLANFIRDVREDRRLDRVYLPARGPRALRRRRGRPARDHASPELRALIAFEVGPRARRCSRAAPSRRSPPRRSSVRPGMRFAVGVYRRDARPHRARSASTCSAGARRAGLAHPGRRARGAAR